MRFPQRAEFDRTSDFIVRRPFRISGADLDQGASFDKTLTTPVRLKSLYESGFLEFAHRKPAPVIESSIDIPEDRGELRSLYERMTGKAPDARWSAATLKSKIEKALS